MNREELIKAIEEKRRQNLIKEIEKKRQEQDYQKASSELQAEMQYGIKPGMSPFEKTIRKYGESFVRPTMQGLGAAGGAVLGAGATAPTVAGIPGGALAGGSLGYATGDQLYRLMRQAAVGDEAMPLKDELRNVGERLVEGTTYEMGGAALGPAVRAVGKGVKGALGLPGKLLGRGRMQGIIKPQSGGDALKTIKA